MSNSIEYIQSSASADCRIAMRKALPKDSPKAVILILHGATLPSIIFDLAPTQGQPSMMSYLANCGYALYSLDYRGYGLSSKPAAMDDPEMAGPPIMTNIEAALDVMDVVGKIQKNHPGLPINLCGFSWGSSISGYLSTKYDWMSKLILLGPVYSCENPQWKELADPNDPTKLNPGIKSYRIARRERWCGLWDRELQGRDAAKYRDPKTLEAVLDHIESTDAKWAQENDRPGYIRISTGVLVNALQTYNHNPIYDASKIQCPTMVLRGDWDTASLSIDADGLTNKLTCPNKRVDIPQATHYGILEFGAERFFKAINDFFCD